MRGRFFTRVFIGMHHDHTPYQEITSCLGRSLSSYFRYRVGYGEVDLVIADIIFRLR